MVSSVLSQRSPQKSRPWAVNRPGFSARNESVARAFTQAPGVWPVSAIKPLGISAAMMSPLPVSIACIAARGAPVGASRRPMPMSASMHASQCMGGPCCMTTPAACARCSDAAASAGSGWGESGKDIHTFLPSCCKCLAASKPSPPLLPRPQATQTVWACGTYANVSCAKASPARCIKVWAGRAHANWASTVRNALVHSNG